MKKVLSGTSHLLAFTLSLLVPAAVFSYHAPAKPTLHQTALTITAPADLSINTDPFSDKASNVALGSPTTTGNVIYTTSDAPQSFLIGTTKVTWLAMDEMGEIVTAVQNVTVSDHEKPYISRIGEISMVNDAGKCEAIVTLMIPYAMDNSGAPVTITHNAPAVFKVGTTKVIWTATDIYGNSDTTVQKITVIDNELPVVSLTTTSYQRNSEPGKCGAAVKVEAPTATDNCGILSINSDAPAVFPVGTTTVTWTVTDLNNYRVKVKQTVTVTDTELPVIVSPANITAATDPGKSTATIAIGFANASDNCGVATVSNDAPASFPLGITNIVWTVTDVNGNKATTTQTVTVVKDLQAPVFTNVPANTTVSCESVPAAVALTATDNLDPAPVVTVTQSSTQGTNMNLSSRYNYTVTRTWTATDRSGNKSTAKQVITVVDKYAPVINVPSVIVAGNDLNTCGAAVSYSVSVTDNAGCPLTITYSKVSGSVFASGNTTVTITAKDVSGNSASASFVVTVNDVQKPTIKAPNSVSVTISGSSGASASNVKLGSPATSDNCGVSTVTNNAPSYYPVGVTTVTWTVRDNAGNTSIATQTVTVNNRKNNGSDELQGKVSTAETGALNIGVAPNPSRSYFTLKLQSNRQAAINLRVMDISGRVVDTRAGLVPNSTVQIGSDYPAGYFIAEIIQGNERKHVQLIKLK
jgi:hypothetical protein